MHSDMERCVTRIVWRQPLLPPFHEKYYASHNQTAYKGGQEKDAGHRKHPDNEVDADIGGRLRPLADVNNDRLVLNQSQEEHQSL
jgi:hypothetical protein